MEPPCEHGGVATVAGTQLAADAASMEPPCEHGGVELAQALLESAAV